MQSAQELLAQLGKPPREVCLDWAWQITKLAKTCQLPQNFTWSNLRVTTDGELRSADVCETSISTSSTIEVQLNPGTRACVRQLLEWSGVTLPNDFSKALSSVECLQTHLSQWTSECLTCSGVDPTTTQVNSYSSVADLSGLGPDSGAARKDTLLCGSDRNDHALDRNTDSLDLLIPGGEPLSTSPASKPNQRSGKPSAVGRLPILVGLAAAAVVAICGAVWWFRSSGQKANNSLAKSNTADSSATSNSLQLNTLKSTRSSKKQNKNSNSEMDDLLGGAGATAKDPLSNSDALANPDSIQTDIDLADSGSGKSSAHPSSTPSQLSSESETAIKPDDQSGSSSKSVTPSSTLDVASETSHDSVAKLLAGVVSGETKVTSLERDSQVPSDQASAAELLNVESIVQMQEVPARVRVRQPAWQLRIASTSAMEVEPATAQTLAEKSMVRWILTSKELKPRKSQEPTKVAVIAEMANRRGDIRWRIVAGTQDLPGLQFPLGENQLDQLLNLLQNYQQRLTISMDQIKAVLEAPDFPKDQRSPFTTKRRAFEAEAKLTTRARQVVADAAMISSWMDRTIEVHGRLLETAGNKSETLVEFGKVELTAPDQPPDTSDSSNQSEKSK